MREGPLYRKDNVDHVRDGREGFLVYVVSW